MDTYRSLSTRKTFESHKMVNLVRKKGQKFFSQYQVAMTDGERSKNGNLRVQNCISCGGGHKI